MKYYDTGFDEYVQSVRSYNIHPELESQLNAFPKEITQFSNVILYGPPGVGKYSQALAMIQRYSPSQLRYDKKIVICNEKTEKKTRDPPRGEKKKTSVTTAKRNDFVYRISDIHYEIDMSLLGCNSKTLWHEIFFQIVDIVSVKTQKVGIIFCKNMHCIYNELLDVFYSYINHPLRHLNVQLHFVLLTESIGFLPNSILNSFDIIRVQRPATRHYTEVMRLQPRTLFGSKQTFFVSQEECQQVTSNMNSFGNDAITNLKEVHVLKRCNESTIPNDVFNTIVDDIVFKMLQPDKLQMNDFRNSLYDMLVYNLDISECVCHILFYMVQYGHLDDTEVYDVLMETFTFFKYYNNNYRPIYHLESIIYYMMSKIHWKTD